MMERGAPSNLTGFPNLVEVPTFYMAFRGNGGNVGPQNVGFLEFMKIKKRDREQYGIQGKIFCPSFPLVL